MITLADTIKKINEHMKTVPVGQFVSYADLGAAIKIGTQTVARSVRVANESNRLGPQIASARYGIELGLVRLRPIKESA